MLLSIGATVAAVASILGSAAAASAAESDSAAATTAPLVQLTSAGGIDLGTLGVVDASGEALAAFLGIDQATLTEEMRTMSLSEIAESAGLSGDDVKNLLRAELSGTLDAAVEEGTMSADDAFVLLSQQVAGLDDVVRAVNGVVPAVIEPVANDSSAPGDPSLAPSYTTETPGG
jgi:hypothetical protein